VSLSRRDWIGATVAVTVALACIRLGVWQIDRLQQRRARNAAAAARRALPPLILSSAGGTLDSARGRRVLARGVFDYDRERPWRGRSFDGTPGVALLTPLRLDDGGALFVDRGWAPSPDAFHLNQLRYREGDTVTVEGLALGAPRARGDVDPAKLRDSLPYPLLPFVVQVVAAPPTGPVLPSGLRRWPVPPLNDGPHLSYAIQWFSFSVIILVGTGALLRKQALA
jgi:surfeit locus 1 family protein